MGHLEGVACWSGAMGWVGFGRWDRGQESTAECRIARRSTVVLLACWCMTPASADAASHAGHACRAKVVKIAVGWGGQLQSTEADVVKGLVVHAHALVCVLDKLVH